jgi:hypothetical protein
LSKSYSGGGISRAPVRLGQPEADVRLPRVSTRPALPYARSIAVVTCVLVAALLLAAAPGANAATPLLRGDWDMRMRVQHTHLISDRQAGDVFHRSWVFHRTCRHGRCQLKVSTERTDGTFDRAKVRHRGGLYLIDDNERSQCRRGGSVSTHFHASFYITDSEIAGDRKLAAAIKGVYRYSYLRPCPGGSSRPVEVTRFTGERTDLPQPPTADFTFSPDAPSIAAHTNQVFFNDQSSDDDGTVEERAWDFGDPTSTPPPASGPATCTRTPAPTA